MVSIIYSLRILFIFIGIAGCIVSARMQAQEVDTVKADALIIAADTLSPPELVVDTLYNVEEDSISQGFLSVKNDTVFLKEETVLAESEQSFLPSPNRAIMYAAIFPGLGQIYNRKYWKLPFVYGGFLGCVYAITWNGDQYNGYKDAYNDFQLNEDGSFVGRDWEAYFRTISEESLRSQHSYYMGLLKRKRDFYRRYKDLSIILTVGVYAISIIDAYVDAQLFDFDISTDLSMRVDPVIYQKTSFNTTSVGLQCSFNF